MRKDRSRTPTPAPSTAAAAETPARVPPPVPCLVVNDSPATTEPGETSPRLDEIDSPTVFKEERDRWTNYLFTHDFNDPEEKKEAIGRWKAQLDQLHIERPIQIKEEKFEEARAEDGQGLPTPEGLPDGVDAAMAEEDRAAHEKLTPPEGIPATDDRDRDMKVEEPLGSPGKRKRPGEGPAEAPQGDPDPYPPVPPPMEDTQVFGGAAQFDMTADDKDEEIKTPRNPEEGEEPKAEVPLSAELLGTMFAQLSAQINNLGSNLNTKITNSDLGLKKLSDKIDAQKDDVRDMVADMIGDAAAASATIASDTQKVINALTTRIDKLEKKRKNEENTPSVPAAATPAAARGRFSASPPPKLPVTPPLVDPFLRRDPWSGWKEKEPTSSPVRSPAPAAAPTYDFDPPKDFKPATRWTPRQVEVKGWCRFKERDRGLNRDEAKALGMQISLALPDDIKKMLNEDDIYAPYLVNRQVNFRVQDPNDIPFIQRAIQLYVKTNGIKVKGRDIYCIQEPSPEARDKNRIVAKATSTLEEHLLDLGPEHHHHMRVDMRAGVCYYQPVVDRDAGLVNIGNVRKKTTWQWHDEALLKAWPGLDIGAFWQATAQVLEE